MHIHSLTLRKFRNYESASFSPSPGVNLITGDNAQGKTNLIEAIFFCCFGRSHRTAHERELIAYDADQAVIELISERTQTRHTLGVALNREQSRVIRADGLPLGRIGELMGLLNCVLFAPEHLSIVKEGPLERRRFIDMELSQTYPSYFFMLQTYNRVLRQRNALLRSIRECPELVSTLPVWNQQLAEAGAGLMRYRATFCEKLSGLAALNHSDLSGHREKLSALYKPQSEVWDAKGLLCRIEGAQKDDLRRMTTQVGPHRDDMEILLDGREIRSFGSQGQQRTAALSLKLSELDLLREETGEWPILMLDDVMSELDEKRQRFLLDKICDVQTLVTTTSAAESWPRAARFYVEGGRISPL